MSWTTVPGLAGKVYVPSGAGQMKMKRACEDCFSCQWCDENRCQVCRIDAGKTRRAAKPDCGCARRRPKPAKSDLA